jgi:hypothetical protein
MNVAILQLIKTNVNKYFQRITLSAIIRLVPSSNTGENMPTPVLSKFPIKLRPVDDMLEHCAMTFDKMIDYAAQSVIDHTDFAQDADRMPTVVSLTMVTPAEGFGLADIDDWLYTNRARGGTLAELCAWLAQYPRRVEHYGHILAPATVLMDSTSERTPTSFMPFARRQGELTYLSLRNYGATWHVGASFLAVLDADNPSS